MQKPNRKLLTEDKENVVLSTGFAHKYVQNANFFVHFYGSNVILCSISFAKT
jgi:hypothetical protein